MIEAETVSALRVWRGARRRAGERVALVPTMGALHDGHLRLVARGKARADRVVMSVFVNPTQFGPDEDFDRYPRDLDRDRLLADTAGVDCLFVPDRTEVYPDAPAVTLTAGTLTDHLCGPHRPGHFAGVMLVVLKLFHMVEPDVAIFGRKDVQQALIIRRLIRDLHVPVELDVAPTVREPDGLALSSRNRYLTEDQRAAASAIPRALEAGHRAFASGRTSAREVLGAARDVLAGTALAVEYVEMVDPHTLAPADPAAADSILAVAARAGDTRLIDNVTLEEGLSMDDFVGN